MADILVNQFEVENDSKGSARAAQWIQDRLAGALGLSATKVLAVARYDRESGAAFIVIIMGTTATKDNGASLANKEVQAITAEIESGGVANLAKALNAAEGFSVSLTNIISLTISRRESGSAFATVLMSN
jgi:hypothetical protein